jgi:glycosyltransferase involved in cell wall biosynthesis
MKVNSASILICTDGRAQLLQETLAALQAMTVPADCATEILIVDNNSTDNTASVVAASAERGPIPIVYVRERQQGKGFALNHGLSQARGEILALTDDDVVPGRDWLERIVDDFRQRDVTFVFGKVVPQWDALPPPELLTPPAQVIWGPLGIVDCGNRATEYRRMPDGPLSIGANIAFARQSIVTIGGWRTDLSRAGNPNANGEDHEILFRLHRHGLFRGYYDPDLTVRHHVPASRLTRRYFRRWFFQHGQALAVMLDDLFPDVDMTRVPRLGGVPRFLYRHALEQVWRYGKALCTRDALGRLIAELQTINYVGLFLGRWGGCF